MSKLFWWIWGLFTRIKCSCSKKKEIEIISMHTYTNGKLVNMSKYINGQNIIVDDGFSL